MDAEQPKDSIEPSARARLRDTIAAFPGQPFAVVDGAHFDDITDLFKSAGLFARSLFLDSADSDVQKAGPWLVKLDQTPEAIDKMLDIVGDKPAAVYWCCGAGEMVLWRHLRTLNMVKLPKWAADGGIEPTDAEDEYEYAFFRHWDPRVLDELMPCLRADQFARFIGPCDRLAFINWLNRLRLVQKDDNYVFSNLPCQSLLIDSNNILMMNRRRVEKREFFLLRHLQENCSDHLKENDPNANLAEIRKFVETAQDFGVYQDEEIAQWAFLCAVFGFGPVKFAAATSVGMAGNLTGNVTNYLYRTHTSR